MDEKEGEIIFQPTYEKRFLFVARAKIFIGGSGVVDKLR